MKDNSEIGFEKELWASADKLRGSMDSSEYKHVILGLVFLKYISDKFEERYKELVENGDGYVREKEDYLCLDEKSDVIELPIDEVFDISGWDIKKALKLLYKSNPSLLEWFASPIVYKETKEASYIREVIPL